MAFPLILPNARIADGCVNKITTHCRVEPITNAQCVATTECRPDANVPDATAISCANLTGWTIGVGAAICEARAWC